MPTAVRRVDERLHQARAEAQALQRVGDDDRPLRRAPARPAARTARADARRAGRSPREIATSAMWLTPSTSVRYAQLGRA